ncbi:MAG: hypothetical protein RMK29_03230 [Myxococcales bacterium]|nr:hypothetical protein [Myxococcota bacterium]MDW8280697.1 hypothetical protein [Myxococcales bacterium]
MRAPWPCTVFVALGLSTEAALAQEADAPDPALREQMFVCTDGKSHYVALAPDKQFTVRLYYGDGKRFFPVPSESGGMLSGDWFFEPRRPSQTNNPSFRGLDLRLYSRVEADQKKRTCAVVCGDQRTELQVMEAAAAKALLQRARFEENPRAWKPYALARDNNGIYYYVDRGYRDKDRGRFRLFVGPKGALKPLKMTNIVSDSQGDIFATKTGSLRLVLDRGQSFWVANNKERPLRPVPVEENLPMIYNDLGVYLSERLGTPCDDM